MSQVLAHVMDALDIETFLACGSEEEGKSLALALMKELGFQDSDIVFIQFAGPGARVRVRAYINRPGDAYPWLSVAKCAGEVQS